MHKKYLRPFISPVFGMFSVLVAVSTGGGNVLKTEVTGSQKKIRTREHVAQIDLVHEQRVRFAADHGVVAPAELVAAVKHSPLADLLISVAIEESRGNPVAVGSSGEKGAWQVKAAHWGSVPEDIHGQAGQAERIIRGLLIRTKGNKKEALARYNGGTAPPGKSYRYAERILKRAGLLQVAVRFLPPKAAASWRI